jgi:AAA ATPase domain
VRSGQITELALGGFQVFEKRTAFPLGPITLLFGPNSAGKSAIADALQVLAGFCSFFDATGPRQRVDDGAKAADLLERHWRIPSGQVQVKVREAQIGIKVRIPRAWWATAAVANHVPHNKFEAKHPRFELTVAALSPWLSCGGSDDLEVQLEFMDTTDSVYPSATVNLAGVPLLRYERHGEVAVHLMHPALGRHALSRSFERLAARFPGDCSNESGWIKFSVGAELFNTGLDPDTLANVIDASNPDGSFDYDCQDACNEFANLFDAIWLNTMASIHREVAVSLVPASRTIPTRHELTYLKSATGENILGSRLGLQIDGRPEYDRLAIDCLRAALGDGDSLDDFPPAPKMRHLDKVNHLLTENIFKERGYFVAAEVHALGRLESFLNQDSMDGAKIPSKPSGYLVSLELGDANYRRFSFDEVGSGLGYVLPVLVGLTSGGTTFVQQPELHLHPALQAELADALISGLEDEFGGAGQRIIETHSEHLLLRLLRRVREGNSFAAPPQYSLRREDLVVLYVNPLPDGTSTVKHLRIARDGDFLDRWPRGFFEERWKDLFDE